MSTGAYNASWVTSALIEVQAEARRKDAALHLILAWASTGGGDDPDTVFTEIRRIARGVLGA